jgi:5-methylcytosine-specific restriction endonuclease McrA
MNNMFSRPPIDYQKIKLNSSVLVLNSDYNPINICNARRAIVLLIKQKACMVTEKVIRLINYIRLPHRRLMANQPTRNLIYKRDGYTCAYCGVKERLTIDHIHPTSRGGQETWENLVTACCKCNSLKGNRTPQESNMILRVIPKAPYNKLHLTINTSNVSDWKEYVYS